MIECIRFFFPAQSLSREVLQGYTALARLENHDTVSITSVELLTVHIHNIAPPTVQLPVPTHNMSCLLIYGFQLKGELSNTVSSVHFHHIRSIDSTGRH